jgi:short-subunit dehydrogenase
MSKKQTILVTGAASGIGRETARLFVRKGWYVGLFDVNEEGLAAVRDELGEANCCALPMDVTDRESVGAGVAYFLERADGVMDVLFNCAGILYMGDYATISLAAQTKTVDVNVTGILNCIDASLPALRRTPGAHIVSMSSASAVYGAPGLAVYSASKFAVRGLTEAMNIELESDAINVSDIMVAYVQTPMVLEADVKAVSVGRLGVKVKPQRVALRVWDAVHANRVHWHVGLDMSALTVVTWLLPFTAARRWLAKLLMH